MGRLEKVMNHKSDMHVGGESDGRAVPAKCPNKDGMSSSAEGAEGRRPTKENTAQTTASQIQSWGNALDGLQRPLGIAALEYKIVQHAVGTVLSQIYEEDFLGFSYGFRPGRGTHDALDALWIGIMRKKVNWVLDADIRDCFGSFSHEWMVKFLQHRIGDRRILRLIQKWLRAGVLEDGEWSETEKGTPQGSVNTPL